MQEAVTEQLGRATMSEAFSKTGAEAYLRSLLNKTLRIQVTDGRMFTGTFKCTDTDRNVVISNTFEYRHPSQREIARAASTAADDASAATVKVDMTSRYLGLVVVPGKHIVKMEVEEFTSQASDPPPSDEPPTTSESDSVSQIYSLPYNGSALATKREYRFPKYVNSYSTGLVLGHGFSILALNRLGIPIEPSHMRFSGLFTS
ncbi:hypothetical protein F5B22DRAFT_622075 [Xylaria bambusicola]|uniref:uncharacterized protein n=1 Tax=Xylaria bambusicola TaxID=326684 RepID=UPI002008319A|nr:uncharacterized protein F5B22DRAFT_622075 [Xylaria bambusicola]KAI0506955.1 hypothetical protein F5B22DRAFT_622075 [Xylaria bambusicola]